MKKLQNILIFAVIVGFVFFLSYLLDDKKSNTTANTSVYEQVEYFKNSDRERIFCIYTTETNSAKIKAWAEKNLMHTNGAFTDAFFYHSKTNIPKITTFVNSELVYLNTMESDYFARYYVNYKGDKSLKVK